MSYGASIYIYTHTHSFTILLTSDILYIATYSENRQDVLATPKRVPPAFLEDRRSVYWVDKQPAMGPTKFGI